MSDPWWKDFFDGLIVEFWQAVVPEETTRAEAKFLEEHLRLGPGSRVLDVPCGAGDGEGTPSPSVDITPARDMSRDFFTKMVKVNTFNQVGRPQRLLEGTRKSQW